MWILILMTSHAMVVVPDTAYFDLETCKREGASYVTQAQGSARFACIYSKTNKK